MLSEALLNHEIYFMNEYKEKELYNHNRLRLTVNNKNCLNISYYCVNSMRWEYWTYSDNQVKEAYKTFKALRKEIND